MARAGTSSELASKLVGYVASPPVGDYNFRVFSNFDKVVAMLALSQYDASTNSALPDLRLNVDSGKKNLLNVSLYCASCKHRLEGCCYIYPCSLTYARGLFVCFFCHSNVQVPIHQKHSTNLLLLLGL